MVVDSRSHSASRHGNALNRFSWPALRSADISTLTTHNETITAPEDAWNQTLTLARIADDKFSACTYAARGFSVFIVAALSCVVTAALTVS